MENQHETIVPSEGREMNFIDLCAACGRAIGRACAACWHLFLHMVRLTYRYWWIVLTLVALAVAGALYYSRHDNLRYKVNAIVLLNGPTIQQFEQSFHTMCSAQRLPQDASISPFVWSQTITDFKTFRVIDCLGDETADFIDFKHKIKPTDTVNVQMQDRLCLQFRLKNRDMHRLPAVEDALLEYFNSNQAMQHSYDVYSKNLRNEVSFNHRQADKLDSLTSCYYFYQPSEAHPRSSGVSFYGDREVELFLEDIYEQHAHLQRVDQRLELATAPVTIENHFAVFPAPVNGRMKCVVVFLLLGWIFGCALAEIIDKRKVILAWLKE